MITILNRLGALGKRVSRFTTVIAKFLQISLAFVRAVLQTMAAFPAKQANLKKKTLVLLYFSRKLKQITSNGAISYSNQRQKKNI